MSETVKISDAGDSLLITATTRLAVDAVLRDFLSQGSKLISDAAPLGAKWLASCTKPLLPQASASIDVDAIAQRAALHSVTISDAGPYLMVSGEDKDTVVAALGELAKTGAEPTFEITQVGKKWIARCENLKFGHREVKVEQFGLSYVISGPNREAVEEKVKEFELKGAKILVNIQKIDNDWIVTCDTGGGHDTVYKW
ncbi:MAG TPA: hypothetical protein VIW78_00295 [Burkholderiales bacterium]